MRYEKHETIDDENIMRAGRDHIVLIRRDNDEDCLHDPLDMENVVSCFFPAQGNYGEINSNEGVQSLFDHFEARGVPVPDVDQDGYEYDIRDKLDFVLRNQGAVGAVILPVSMTEHSGVAYNIGSPRDRWDSRLCGVAWATSETLAEYGVSPGQFPERLKRLLDDYTDYGAGGVYEVYVLKMKPVNGVLKEDPYDLALDMDAEATFYNSYDAEKLASEIVKKFEADEKKRERIRPR